MRLGFDASAINERGISVALHDYAEAAQSLLGHDVVVFYDRVRSAAPVTEMFARTFRMVGYDPEDDLRRVTEPHALDFCYFIHAGVNTSRVRAAADRIGVHVVFRHYEPHGDVYAYVSDWLSDWMTGGRVPVVPHIVKTPKPAPDLRSELGIPHDAFVVGRLGGLDQFNLQFVKKAIAKALPRRSNLHFLFVNTAPFIEHERVRFLPMIVDQQKKANFIASCDVGLNAKKIGESFGLAIAEFLALGKPVFAWAGGQDGNHVHMIPDRSWLYRTRRNLLDLLVNFELGPSDADRARAAVAEFAPEPVIRQFERVFLSGEVSPQIAPPSAAFILKRSVQERWYRLRNHVWRYI